MSNTTLLPQTGSATTGSSLNIGTNVSTLNLQFSPQASIGYSGTVIIEASTAPSPGANDWFTIATVAFTAHTTVLDFNLYFTNNPWIRARMPSNGTLGAMAVYAAY